MPRPIYPETVHTRQRGHDRSIDTLYRRGPGPWVEPALLNGWTNAGTPYAAIAYRHDTHSVLEFKGHITPGTSGTVAFVLEEPYWPETDLTFLTDIVNGPGFSVARVRVDKDNGNVTITYPAT